MGIKGNPAKSRKITVTCDHCSTSIVLIRFKTPESALDGWIMRNDGEEVICAKCVTDKEATP